MAHQFTLASHHGVHVHITCLTSNANAQAASRAKEDVRELTVPFLHIQKYRYPKTMHALGDVFMHCCALNHTTVWRVGSSQLSRSTKPGCLIIKRQKVFPLAICRPRNPHPPTHRRQRRCRKTPLPKLVIAIKSERVIRTFLSSPAALPAPLTLRRSPSSWKLIC